MTNNFWFYFFGIPFLFGLFCFSVPMSFKLTNEIPTFQDALDYCKYEDNDIVYSDIGTAQDKCIDNYMAWPLDGNLLIFLVLGLMGMIFFIPFSIYFIFRLFKN
tara:strand:- start:25 stop:336 length:312 start_codon:yes stop_codon:yes gene_type:complete